MGVPNFLLLLVFSVTLVTSHEQTVYPPNVYNATNSFHCNYMTDSVYIQPSTRNATILVVRTSTNKVDVWIKPKAKYVMTLLIKGQVAENETKVFVAAPSDGFVLHSSGPACEEYGIISVYSFFRFNDEPQQICDRYARIVHDDKVQVIQHRRPLRISQKCPYHLVPKYAGDILYIISNVGFRLYAAHEEYEFYREFNNLHVIHNYTKVTFSMFFETTKDEYPEKFTDQVSAISTNIECECDKRKITLRHVRQISLFSPGYPNFLCPQTSCLTTIILPEMDYWKGSPNYTNRLLVSIWSHAHRGTALTLKTNASRILLDSNTHTNVAIRFLLEETDLTISYHTLNYLNLGDAGNYKIILQRISIEYGCTCPTFSHTQYTSDFRVRVLVPGYCVFMSCAWKFGNGYGSSGFLRIELFNGSRGDGVQIWNKNTMKVYNSTELKTPIIREIVNEKSPTNVIFLRQAEGRYATFYVSWMSGVLKSREQLFGIANDKTWNEDGKEDF